MATQQQTSLRSLTRDEVAKVGIFFNGDENGANRVAQQGRRLVDRPRLDRQ